MYTAVYPWKKRKLQEFEKLKKKDMTNFMGRS
jgi:hypothetical protein